MGSIPGISTRKKATSHSSSWDKLTQDLNNLTLNSGTTQALLVQERMVERLKRRKLWQQKHKRMFQSLMQEWTEYL